LMRCTYWGVRDLLLVYLIASQRKNDYFTPRRP
jgi:hypothetical protein